MKLTIIGSGTVVIRKQRKGLSLLLEIGKQLLLFDCGWGCGVNLLNAGFDIQKLDHIFITHPHSDHLGDLINILHSMVVSGLYYPQTKRTKSLYLHGYKGFKKDYESLRDVMFPVRIEPFKIKIFEYLNNRRKFDNFVIQAREVKHFPQIFHSVAFCLKYKNKIFFYSGDTSFDKTLIELAKNAQVGVFEAAVSPQEYQKFGPSLHHLSALEAGVIAQKARLKKLVLVHLYDIATPSQIEKEVRRNFKGKLIIAKDLQIIKI